MHSLKPQLPKINNEDPDTASRCVAGITCVAANTDRQGGARNI